ncbi:MAG: response regulator [Lachnospiraceae bacterium]|nr:response regulator [Lachnospiraceae bacterium]
MAKRRMIFTGEKESFILRVLIKKVQENGVDCGFVPWTISDIKSNIDNTLLITLFMEEGGMPAESVIHYLSDIMEDKGLQMLIVGEQHDIDDVLERIPGDLVYKTFARPVDNADFTNTVTEYLKNADSGVFRKNILVVDDDPQYLTMIREWLKGTYKVTMVNSGLQAIKWLGKNKADLILLDHEMPVTSGPQVLEMLRSETDTSSIPVIFLTGKKDKESVMSVVALRPEGYILKGIKKEELLEKLHEFFILRK